MLLTLVELQRKLMTQIREYSVLPDCDGGLWDAIDDTIDELMCLFSNEQAKADPLTRACKELKERWRDVYTTIMQYAACRDFVDAETYVRGAMDFNALVAGLFDRDGDLIPARTNSIMDSWEATCLRPPLLTAERAARIEDVVRTFKGTTVYDAYFKAHCAGVRGDSGAAIAKQKAADAVARVIKDKWSDEHLEQWHDRLGIVNAMAHHEWYVKRKYMDNADSLGDCMKRRATALTELSPLIDKIARETDKANRM